jgi:hypothetical protein
MQVTHEIELVSSVVRSTLSNRLTRFCWRARPLSTAHQKVVVGDRMYADRQMCKTWKAIFFCVSGAETTREQIGELRAEESHSLIAKDLKELRTCAIGQTGQFPSADAACVNGNDVDKNVAIFSLSVRVAVPIVR